MVTQPNKPTELKDDEVIGVWAEQPRAGNGVYPAVLQRVFHNKEGKFGPSLMWIFRITAPAVISEHGQVNVVYITGTTFTSGNKAGKLYMALTDQEDIPVKQSITVRELLNRRCQLVIEEKYDSEGNIMDAVKAVWAASTNSLDYEGETELEDEVKEPLPF